MNCKHFIYIFMSTWHLFLIHATLNRFTGWCLARSLSVMWTPYISSTISTLLYIYIILWCENISHSFSNFSTYQLSQFATTVAYHHSIISHPTIVASILHFIHYIYMQLAYLLRSLQRIAYWPSISCYLLGRLFKDSSTTRILNVQLYYPSGISLLELRGYSTFVSLHSTSIILIETTQRFVSLHTTCIVSSRLLNVISCD